MYNNPYPSGGESAQDGDMSGWGKLLLSYMADSPASGTPTADQAAAFSASAWPVNADYATQLRAGQGDFSGADPFYTGNRPAFDWSSALKPLDSVTAARAALNQYASVPVNNGSGHSSY